VPTIYIYVFYSLVLLQILLGCISLWSGAGWFRMVRRSLEKHGGFYAPQVAVICPCKGEELGLEENLTALARFDYPNYEVFIPVASNSDPVLRIIARVQTGTKVKIHTVIAGPPEKNSEKVHNLTAAVEAIPETFDVFVFTDSDARPGRNWLAKLVAPLGDPRVGAASTYRWMFPTPSRGKSSLAGAVASAWNAAVVTLLGTPAGNFCWGGGTAIRRNKFIEINVLGFWDGSVSDDWSMTAALRRANEEILFVPECLAPSPIAVTWSEMLEFTTRQMKITRVYDRGTWNKAALAHLSYSVTALYALVIILMELVSGDPWIQLALVALIVPLLSAAKGALRCMAVSDVLPEWKKAMGDWSWACVVLPPFVPFLVTCNIFASLASRTICWRGIRYELISTNQTRILGRS
jgi:cellulose synthase/poly-beta-1,6-N-acetylglucosamine synthase-like glycosyltransferase